MTGQEMRNQTLPMRMVCSMFARHNLHCHWRYICLTTLKTDMADPATCLPLEPESIRQTHQRIKQYIHRTPVLTSRSLDTIASSPDPRAFLADDPPSVWSHHQRNSNEAPNFNLYFKMESVQRIGAFKARGAFSAVTHLIEELGLDAVRNRGVITHSSGNHAQALALAASTYQIPGFIVMPSISTKSKISGTKANRGVEVVFSGSTAPEREQLVNEVIEHEKKKKGNEGPILVPPYDHPDIVLGQGTAALEMEEQFHTMKSSNKHKSCSHAIDEVGSVNGIDTYVGESRLDAVLTPLGGGGLLAGTATWFSHTRNGQGKRTLVFGSEPHFEGANDGERGLASIPPKRIEHVKSLTIADGVRTPVGIIPWTIISDKLKLQGVYSVSELEIKMALKLVLERMKIVIEPSSAVPIAVVLFNESFRQYVWKKQKEEGSSRAWDVGIIISGGNTTVEALSKLFQERWLDEDETSSERDRATAQMASDGRRKAEDVAG